jgi:hypothetical protein
MFSMDLVVCASKLRHNDRDTTETFDAQPVLERGKSSGIPQIVRSAAANLSIDHLMIPSYSRKASASVLAVDERQSLETLTRDEKTASRSLTQLKDNLKDLDQKNEKFVEDARVHSECKAQVRLAFIPIKGFSQVTLFLQLEQKMTDLRK